MRGKESEQGLKKGFLAALVPTSVLTQFYYLFDLGFCWHDVGMSSGVSNGPGLVPPFQKTDYVLAVVQYGALREFFFGQVLTSLCMFL